MNPFLYHITHIDHLPQIIESGCVFCDREVATRVPNGVSIAHERIKARRQTRMIPVPPGGVVADYTPFYFAPRSPMLFANYKRSVPQYQDGQEPIIYLVSSFELVTNHELSWCFTDRNAVHPYTQFFNDAKDFNHVDWKVMKAPIWRNTMDDPDRMDRRNAEFLVRDALPFTAVNWIAASSNYYKKQVSEALDSTSHKPDVKVHREWYF